MEGPQQLKISDFSYVLPEEKIALYPLPRRDAAKLLVYKGGLISENSFQNLPQLLPQNTLLVFNNTRVIPARLLFQKSTGTTIEIFVLEPADTNNLSTALQQAGNINYLCLIKGAAKWKNGELVKSKTINNEQFVLKATLLEKKTDAFLVSFSWKPASISFAEILQAFGEMPIPPYLHRTAEDADAERYQTIYATHNGSVAAPTAGLHFTQDVLQSLKEKNISITYTTLHVGAGTFKPVKAEILAGHEMHAEWITVDKTLLEKLIEEHTIIPVGTTSMRTLESLYWLGLKTIINPKINLDNLFISQWEVYNEKWPDNITTDTAIKALLMWIDVNGLAQFVTRTQILIAPGYVFKICKGLITNFHQPQSTLLLLIAALIGNNWKKVYEYALENNFRFLSYGDSSFLMNSEP